jgi:hypothetical protein
MNFQIYLLFSIFPNIGGPPAEVGRREMRDVGAERDAMCNSEAEFESDS